MDATRKKRFIAGASCPQCQAMDSIMLFTEQGVEVMECVECGHQQRRAEAPAEKRAGAGQVIGVFNPD
ncbi:YheV family putative metal-binding protein [Ferrimonas sediminicola]|uniref:YheV family putative metal-binding protein n=2 Tax=Ferrimonas sediminicola TaxID=2569538 RepID=A0A4U1BBX1_9GAMM|nr:YheV family putative zinc ribbon protein [Ferrimonas sediminicola]TKB48110.1 YheV family putative metal-binding protein [Ferrimonas sediminicola]